VEQFASESSLCVHCCADFCRETKEILARTAAILRYKNGRIIVYYIIIIVVLILIHEMQQPLAVENEKNVTNIIHFRKKEQL